MVPAGNVWVDDAELLRLVSAVDSEVKQLRSSAEVSSIPREIHFIWLGGSLPVKYESIVEGWRSRHPDWKVIVWTDADAVAFMSCESTRKQSSGQFQHATNYGMKSDIFRYEILLNRGGVYVDIDYECVQPLESATWWGSFAAFAGWSHTRALEINNGIMGCTAGHPLFRQIVDVISRNADLLPVVKKSAIDFAGLDSVLAFLGADRKELAAVTSHDAAMKIITSTGPGMFTRQVYAFLSDQESGRMLMEASLATEAPLIILPRCVFHPVPNTVDVDIADAEKLAALKAEWAQKSTLAIHWWQKSWQAQC